MRRFDPKTPELRVHWLRFFASEKLPEGTRERHSIEACSIAIADVRFLFANLAATTFSRPAVAQIPPRPHDLRSRGFGPW